MGAFYGSIHVRTENSDAVRKALDLVAKEAGLQFPARPGSQWLDQCFSHGSGQNDQISANIRQGSFPMIFSFDRP